MDKLKGAGISQTRKNEGGAGVRHTDKMKGAGGWTDGQIERGGGKGRAGVSPHK